MKELVLSGKTASGVSVKLDDDDYEKYRSQVWHLSDNGYAVRRNNGKTTRLHRLIMQCPEGMVVDHLNGDKLDCRKSNMRICTQAENARNRHDTRGYCFDKSRNKWMVRYHNKFCGRYDTKEEAKEALRLIKSGQEYQTTRRKYYMLPKHISKQFGKYVVSVQMNGVRYRKAGITKLSEALRWRDNILEKGGLTISQATGKGV